MTQHRTQIQDRRRERPFGTRDKPDRQRGAWPVACAQIKEFQTGEGSCWHKARSTWPAGPTLPRPTWGEPRRVLSARFLGVSSMSVATEIPLIGAEQISHMFRKTSNMPLKKAGRPLRAALPLACAEKTLG